MCLDKITKRLKGSKREVVAYKVFYADHFNPKKMHFPYRGGTAVVGEWIHADEKLLRLNFSGLLGEDATYSSGFHAYKMPRDAKREVVELDLSAAVALRVQLRQVHTHGMQGGSPVLVAREMFIPEPKGKKAK